ncbi:MAG: serine hydrolase [Patescibacteria group bacterium]
MDELEESKDRGPSPRKFKDLKPENKKKRKELPKPWGRRERLLVLVVFLALVFLSLVLSLSSRNFKLPGLPRLRLPTFNWGSETIVIEGNKKERERVEAVKNSFNDLTRALSGLYSLYIIDLPTALVYGVSEKEVMQAASLIKLPIMSLVYQKYEEGKININEKVPGSQSTYKDLVEAMGKRSDNNAQITLVKSLGKEEIQRYIEGIGMLTTSLAENETTPADIGLFFQKLWENKLVSQESRDEILNFLTDTTFEDWIVKGIPQVRVAHKYGREIHVVNDAGIIFTAEPFVLVIMSDGIVEKEADEVIPRIAKMVYDIEGAR